MKIYTGIKQGTEDWELIKLGKFSASIFSDLFAKETTATYEKAIYRVAYERYAKEKPEKESFKSGYMSRGNEIEDEARIYYEMTTFNKVKQVGFVELSKWAGCSPDGLIGNDGLLEIKCIAYNTLIRAIMKNKKVDTYDKWQVHFQMFVTGRKWVDFLAYHPKLKSPIDRIYRDEEIIKEIEIKLNESILKVKEVLKKLDNDKKD